MFHFIILLVILGLLFTAAALVITFTSRTIKVDVVASNCMDIGVGLIILAALLQLMTS